VFETQQGKGIFFPFSKTSIPAEWAIRPLIRWIPGPFVRGKVAWTLSLPLSYTADVKNEWSCHSATIYTFTIWTDIRFYLYQLIGYVILNFMLYGPCILE
jgi:hypothetical protein